MEIPDKKVMQWAKNIDQYFFKLLESGEVGDDVFMAYRNTFAEILSDISRKVAPKENWEIFFIEGTVPLIRSDKFQSGFYLGTWLDTYFYLEAPIHYPRHIYHMPDAFWKIYLELHNYGKLGFNENKSPKVPKCIRSQTKNTSKISLFKLIRNYILLSLKTESGILSNTDPLEDIGSIEVTWPRNIKIEEFINNVYEVFKRVYQINYMLYRQEYISLHGKNN